MSLRLVDFLALEPVAAGLPRVVAGADHLEREVRWAHVFETREIALSLDGGEVLLTTGIELAAMRPAEVAELIADVDARGAAALALEIGRVLREPPPALVAAADRHGLPLVVFSRRVRFVEITQAVAELQLGAEVTRLRRAVDVQARLRASAQEGLGPAALVTAVSEALDAQVLLEWDDGSALTSAPDEGLDRAFLDALDATRAGRPSALLSQRVAVPGRRSAQLHALVPEATELDRLALSETAFVLAVALAAEPSPGEVASGDRARLVQRLAEGRAGSAADVRRRARSVGVDLSGAPLAAVVARGVQRPGELADALGLPALVEHGPGGRARAVVAARGGDPRAALERAALALADGDQPVAAAVGLGVRGDEPWELSAAFGDADRAALAAEALRRPARFADELGALGPVAAAVLDGERPAAALSARDERLVDALVASGFAVAAAARRLGVSRQSLYGELRRASVRLGVDLLGPEAAVELPLRLVAHRMQVAAEDGGARW